MPSSPEINLSGRIQHITYYNRENHFTIARLRTDENQRTITIKGTLPDPAVGKIIEVRGCWETHSRYGQQLKISAFRELLPATVDSIRSYLRSGFIKGVGRKLVERIIGHFQGETLAVIESEPARLTEVKGIGKKTARRITAAWQSHHAARQLMAFLEKIGVDTSHAARLLKAFGSDVIDILCNDPYRVAEEIPRIGFRIADAVVRHADTPVDEMDRAKACLIHLFEQAVDQGHAYIVQDDLLNNVRGSFEIDNDTGLAALDHLVEAGDLVKLKENGEDGEPLVFPRQLHKAEVAITRRMAAMLAIPLAGPPPDSRQITRAVLENLAITLSAQQEKILTQMLAHKVSVITGGPGTGKTTLIRAVSAVMKRLRRRVMLAAPTGRAARRLSEVTGRQAATLHKYLGYNLADGLFERSEDAPLEVDVVIVDEASMVDTLLMAQLIRAVPVTATLILVGDVFQLPSVGPGNVLADLIGSQTVPTFELTEIFRQAEQSPIVVNAHRVRKGKPPIVEPPDDPDGFSDFYFVEQADPQKVVQTVIRLCQKEIPNHFRLDPIRDVQVLTPMHRGQVGTLNLNRVLQKALNASDEEMEAVGSRFKTGDKVMHLRNNYRKEVFNGDIGIVAGIDPENERIAVDYDGRMVDYEFVELDELSLAYAISVHKSQGSEYPAVVIPLLTQHYIMLQRNLLYTALTRGRQLVVMVGTAKALDVALKNDRPRQRRSMLAERLRTEVGGRRTENQIGELRNSGILEL
jgi:exodeoxyribonuclease V alpha subunit